MNPETPTPTLADGQPPTDLARRVGPPLAVVSTLLTAGLLAWLAVAPTAIAGPISEAPFTVEATLLVPPDEDGCLSLVDGSGDTTTHCLDELARDEETHHWLEVGFDGDGEVWVLREDVDGRARLTIDPATGEVLEREDFELHEDEGFFASPEDADPTGPPPEPGVYTDGDVVRRFDDRRDPMEEPTGEVVLDLAGPPGYWLRDAAVSPDDRWVVVTTPDDRVAIAPVDGSSPPYVWAELPDDRWIDLRTGIRWDS